MFKRISFIAVLIMFSQSTAWAVDGSRDTSFATCSSPVFHTPSPFRIPESHIAEPVSHRFSDAFQERGWHGRLLLTGLQPMQTARFLETEPASCTPRDGEAPGAVAFTPVYYGQPRHVVEHAFSAFFEEAWVDRDWGQEADAGPYFTLVLRGMTERFGFSLPEDSLGKKALRGARESDPSGRSGFAAGTEDVLQNFASLEFSAHEDIRQAERALHVFTSSCSPVEQRYNADIAAILVGSPAFSVASHRALSLILTLRDTACISSETFITLAPSLVRDTQASLESLDPGEYIRALFVLLHAGSVDGLTRGAVQRILGYQPTAERRFSPISGRRDVMLAATYILAHVLVQDRPKDAPIAIADAITRMTKSGMAPASSALSHTLPSLQAWQIVQQRREAEERVSRFDIQEKLAIQKMQQPACMDGSQLQSFDCSCDTAGGATL